MLSRRRFAAALPAGVALAGAGLNAQAQARSARRPNFLVIVADDLGFSDLGAFGGEIETPNLDRLAARGLRLTGYHTAATCSPTRAMLMSGVDAHKAGLGTMAEIISPAQRGQAGYEGYLSRGVAALPELLKAGGYRTVMSGKWHLGLTEAQSPAARGFERSFALLGGAHNHFGIGDQDPSLVGTPLHAAYREDGKSVRYPEGRYSSDYFGDRMIEFLKAGEADPRPVFAYLTFSAPHWPLQAPPESIAKYRGRYVDGPEALRRRRLARQRELGLAPQGGTTHAIVENSAWTGLTPEQQAIEARKMEIYAAMVDRMDANIGRVLAELQRQKRLDDTVVIFMSDNGAEGWPLNGQGGVEGARQLPGVDNSLAELGGPKSYISYGMGWAQAASAPARYVKGTPYEGGLRVPAIVAGPGVEAGRISSATAHVMDITPTVLELAGVPHPGRAGGSGALKPVEGRSWAPLLAGRVEAVRSDEDVLGWELFHRRGVRQGDWKAVYIPSTSDGARYSRVDPDVPGEWQLFNLRTDPGETRDLAAREPAVLQRMVQAWTRYAAENGVVIPAALRP